MASAAQYAKIKSIVEADRARTVVVVSAAGKRMPEDHKVTDLLYLCHAHMRYGVSCDSVFSMISARYLEIRNDLGLSIDLESELARIRDGLEDDISEDALASRGEYLSARLMADYLGVDQEFSYAALQRLAEGRKIVIPGFYGLGADGNIRTFSRGGSDITGALAAAALDAEIYENWTDVSGILMADPRIVENPEPIPRVTYAELRELSYLGAQVLHEDTIFPVAEKNIPLNIRNTNDPTHPGTIIMERFDDDPDTDRHFITGIAGKKDFAVVSISKKGLSSEVGTMRKAFEVFETNGLAVEYTPNGVDTVCLVVSAKQLQKRSAAIVAGLQEALEPDRIEIADGIAIVAAVGRKMARCPGIAGQIFSALGDEGINIRLISQGPQEDNIIVGVDSRDFNAAVRVLYNSFVR